MFPNCVLELLCNNACPSIRYRVRREILGKPTDSIEMSKLQDEILEDRSVQDIFSWQKPDGWLGGKFHSGHDPETGIRVLSEKGVSSNHEVIIRALDALRAREDDFDDGCLKKVGKILDQKQLGGSNLIRAVVFAYTGREDTDYVEKQVRSAIEGFRYVLSVNSIENITMKYKETVVFRENVKWPSIYDLRLLAATQKWRTMENILIVAEAIKKLITYSPIPDIKVLNKSQIISPASAFMLDFNPKMDKLTPKEWMMWFHRTELLARLGIVKDIPELKKQIDYLEKLLLENGGLFTLKLSHYYFNKWNMYVGLALEDNWKEPMKRVYDLTFRSMLILHYSRNTF